ncbi:hypothetical protein PanWU01x14_019260 [Parasponia andersonii]|uniref:Uncharacterized protein n=1 Tax=Parasponia andersonii TaxID=3476 RepID=A0A2P5DZE5_PARAD|nr:hypothetical protein PanWU01x14_019260 [Parasponia andersonii]
MADDFPFRWRELRIAFSPARDGGTMRGFVGVFRSRRVGASGTTATGGSVNEQWPMGAWEDLGKEQEEFGGFICNFQKL